MPFIVENLLYHFCVLLSIYIDECLFVFFVFFFCSGAITNKAAMRTQKSCSSSYMSASFHFFQVISLGMQWLGNIAG